MFLQRLKIALAGRVPEEIEPIIQDYEAYFNKAKQNGLSEEENHLPTRNTSRNRP